MFYCTPKNKHYFLPTYLDTGTRVVAKQYLVEILEVWIIYQLTIHRYFFKQYYTVKNLIFRIN